MTVPPVTGDRGQPRRSRQVNVYGRLLCGRELLQARRRITDPDRLEVSGYDWLPLPIPSSRHACGAGALLPAFSAQ
jgi:hypothetical protein